MATTSRLFYVSGDFGHGDCVPSFLCFRWFRSLRPRPICFRRFWLLRSCPVICMFQVISIMATVSRPLYVSSDFCHYDRVPSFVCFRWFRSLQPRPDFFRLWWPHPILVFLQFFCFGHCDRVSSFLDFRCFWSWQPRPIFHLDLSDSSLCTPYPHNFIFHPTFV